MKKLIFLLLISSAALWQVDSSKLPIELNLKGTHLAYMGYLASKSSKLEDARYIDSLRLYWGQGLLPQSVVTVRFNAGMILRFAESILDEQNGAGYNIMNELATSVAPQWPGLTAQLLIIKFGNGPQKLIGTWLSDRISERFNAKKAIWTQYETIGAAWLNNPINYN